MKAVFYLSLIFGTLGAFTPLHWAVAQRYIDYTQMFTDSRCLLCWGQQPSVDDFNGSFPAYENENSCDSVCSDYCEESAAVGMPPGANAKLSCTDFKKLMMQLREKSKACAESFSTMTYTHPRTGGGSCYGNTKSRTDELLSRLKVEHDKCTPENAPAVMQLLDSYNNDECVNAYKTCQRACKDDRVAEITLGSDKYQVKAHNLISVNRFNHCNDVWVNQGFESSKHAYEEYRTAAANNCEGVNPNSPTVEADPSEDDDDKKSRSKTNPSKIGQYINNGMTGLNTLGQMASPSVSQSTGGIDYAGPGGAQVAPVGLGSGFDVPDFLSSPPSSPSADEPFGDDSGDSSGRSSAQNTNSGNQPMNNGFMPGMAGGNFQGMGNDNGSGNEPAKRRSGRRVQKKRDKNMFSSKLIDGDPAAYLAANPEANTQAPTRSVGYDQNGQKIDVTFDPNKYAPQINKAYNQGINSPAMRRAMRRAAGFETLSSENSKGYTNWHQKHNIHPGQLSIFKQVRLCYILKYSSANMECGPVR